MKLEQITEHTLRVAWLTYLYSVRLEALVGKEKAAQCYAEAKKELRPFLEKSHPELLEDTVGCCGDCPCIYS